VVTIGDDGPGIPAEYLARLFEHSYHQVRGHRLGLAISKSLIEQHGGRIEVTSDPGRGSSFLIVLPATPIAARAPDTPAAPVGA
jgi:signal transduction histidine kinase